MLNTLAERGREGDASVVGTSEHQSEAMVEMYATTKRSPIVGVLYLRIDKLRLRHKRCKQFLRRERVFEWFDTKGVRRKSGWGAAA